MDKTYELERNEWLLAKIASSFGDKAYKGNSDLIEQAKFIRKGIIKTFIFIIALLLFIVPFFFFSLMNLFSKYFAGNIIFLFIAVLLTALLITLVMLFISVQSVKKTFIRSESVANLNSNSYKINFIKLTNEYMAVNMFNRSDIYVDFPIKNIKNMYFVYGDLTLFHKHRYLFSDMEEELVSARFKPLGFHRNNSESNAYAMIDGKPTYIYEHKGKLQIERFQKYYRKYFHIDIDGNIEDDGYFLFIFTKDHEYHILYLPNSIIKQGFIHDLELILNQELNNTIKTPLTYKEFYKKDPIKILSGDKEEDLESLIPLREKLEQLKEGYVVV